MRLFIDTHDNTKTVVGLDDDLVEKETGSDKSQQVLFLMEVLLKKRGKTLKDIREIKVETGPGSFTGLRVGIAIANTLGWALKVPVNGKMIDREGPMEPVYE